MRIGIDIRALGGVQTGIGRYLINLLRALSSVDGANEYVYFYNMMKGEMPTDLPKNDRIRTVSVRLPNRFLNVLWAFTSFPRVESFVGKVEVFHSPNFQMAPVGRAASVLSIHDLVFLLHPEMAIPSSVRHFRPRIRYYVDRADLIVAGSRATASDIISQMNVPEDKVVVVHYGTIPIASASPETAARAKSEFAIQGNYILFVSCLEPRKNLVRLLKAFEISGLADDFELILVGPKGWHMEEFFRTWRSLNCRNRIRWLHYMSGESLAALYSGASFLAYPSVLEGFGLPILEAMSVGCPVLTSNVSSMPEVAGDAALFVDPFDIESIADGLRRLAQDSALRARLSQMGPARAATFTWEKTAQGMISVYEQAVNTRTS